MIFVYPVVCSDNVDNRVLPAVCRSLEKFYLSNICEAFSSGDLTPVSVWNKAKRIYGPIMLESVTTPWPSPRKGEGEPDEDLSPTINPLIDAYNKGCSTLDKFGQKVNNFPVNRALDSKVYQDYISNLEAYRSAFYRFGTIVDKLQDALDDAVSKSDGDQKIRAVVKSINNEIKRDNSKYQSWLKVAEDRIRDHERRIEVARAQKERDEDKARSAAEEERQKKEREAENMRRHGGSWTMHEVRNIGFEPTMATVEVRVQYIGGDHATSDVYNRDAKVNMPVGVKLVPSVVPSESIKYALLSDATRSSMERFLVGFGRKIIRQVIRFGEWFVRWVTGRNVDIANSTQDEIGRQVLYAPQHLVNASGFKRHDNTSNFYRYTSGVVVFNKEEVSEIDDVINDRNFMSSILKMGWNSICVLDDVGEEALFISIVDGGYIHRLPYAYIFGSIGMTTTYENIDKLQKHTAPFNRSEGRGFSPFGQKVMNESFAEIFNRFDDERDQLIRGSLHQFSLDSDSYYR